jgi:hypothetical protein
MLKELAGAAAVHRGAGATTGHRRTGRTSAPRRCRPSQVRASLLHLTRRAPLSSLMVTKPQLHHLVGRRAIVSSAVVPAAATVTAPSTRATCPRMASQAGWANIVGHVPDPWPM